MTLCSLCQNFSIHSFSEDPDGIRAYKLETVQSGKEFGCEFCSFLTDVLKDDIAYTPFVPARTWVRMRFTSDAEEVKGKSALAYNKFFVKLADSVFPKPRKARDDGGKEHELCIAAEASMSTHFSRS